MVKQISRAEGRLLFGQDPAGYDKGRPAYPASLYQELMQLGALFESAAVLEIGPGSGSASHQLLALGAGSLTLIEPDQRFHPYLLSRLSASAAGVELLGCPFEDYVGVPNGFDLIVAATAFHWLDETSALLKMASLLRPGGHIALWWNVLTNLDRADAFHDATLHLFTNQPVSPMGQDQLPFPLNQHARFAALRQLRGFTEPHYFERRWTHVTDGAGVRALYGGFSHVQRMNQGAQTALLDQLEDIANSQFNGCVERNVTTVMYCVRKLA